MPFAALVAVFILPLIPLLFPPSCPSLPTFEINLKIVVAFCGSFFPFPPLSLSLAHTMEQIGLKTRPKEFAFMSTTRFFFHYTALVFFSLLFPLSLFLFGQNSKIT